MEIHEEINRLIEERRMIIIKRIAYTEHTNFCTQQFRWVVNYVLIKDNQRLDSFLKFRNAVAKCKRLNEKWRYEK